MTELPLHRAGPLWLPVLGQLVTDQHGWGYPDRSRPRGFARLRVWDVDGGGCYAVVTETGTGLSVTSAAADIRRALRDEYGEPFGLAELWPQGHSGPVHLDAVVPAPHLPRGVSWYRLWPTGLGGTVANWQPDVARTWWLVNGERILAP